MIHQSLQLLSPLRPYVIILNPLVSSSTKNQQVCPTRLIFRGENIISNSTRRIFRGEGGVSYDASFGKDFASSHVVVVPCNGYGSASVVHEQSPQVAPLWGHFPRTWDTASLHVLLGAAGSSFEHDPTIGRWPVLTGRLMMNANDYKLMIIINEGSDSINYFYCVICASVNWMLWLYPSWVVPMHVFLWCFSSCPWLRRILTSFNPLVDQCWLLRWGSWEIGPFGNPVWR